MTLIWCIIYVWEKMWFLHFSDIAGRSFLQQQWLILQKGLTKLPDLFGPIRRPRSFKCPSRHFEWHLSLRFLLTSYLTFFIKERPVCLTLLVTFLVNSWYCQARFQLASSVSAGWTQTSSILTGSPPTPNLYKNIFPLLDYCRSWNLVMKLYCQNPNLTSTQGWVWP